MTGQAQIIKKTGIIVNGLILLLILIHSVHRDLLLEKQYTGDLRNRVVGARLQKDGRLPYFYYWQHQDGIRYFDPKNSNKSASFISDITASPFFHQLLYPVCDLDQKTLSKGWMGFQYLLLAAFILVACRMTDDKNAKWLTINAAILFTTTEAWKSLISNGQIYFFCAFLVLCIISGILSNKKSGFILAGILTAAWILNRPIGLVVLLPLFLLYKPKKLFLTTVCSCLAIYGVFVLSSPFERTLWKNYAEGVMIHARFHHDTDSTVHFVNPAPEIKTLEGIDFSETYKNDLNNDIHVYTENGNFFVIWRELLHKKISLACLNGIAFLTITCLFVLFYFYYHKRNLQPVQVLLFAFTLYMVVEFFNPVHRHQYNAVQWFPLVVTALQIDTNRKKLQYGLLALGLFLNIVNYTWVPMRHTLGELVWMATMIWISFSGLPSGYSEKNPSAFKQEGL